MPAFPNRALVPAQRRVGHGVLARAPVVRKKEDQRVFRNARVSNRAHDFAQAVVHRLHHLAIRARGIVRMKVFLFRPANRGIIRPLQRGVYGFVSHVQAKGHILVVFDELHRMLRDEMRGITLFLDVFEALPPVIDFHAVVVRDIVDIAADIPAKPIKPVVHGIEFFVVTQVPLAKDRGRITGFLEQFGKGEFGGMQPQVMIRVLRIGVDHIGHACALLIAAREQPGARGATHHTAGVKVRKFEALARQEFHCGRVDPASVRAGIAIAHVVCQDDDDVGFVHCPIL